MQAFLRRLVIHLAAPDSVGAREPGDSGLRANGAVAQFQIVLNGGDGFVYIGAVGMTVNHHAIPRRSSEELIDGHAQNLPAYVPERSVYRANRRHGHRAATPIGAFVK